MAFSQLYVCSIMSLSTNVALVGSTPRTGAVGVAYGVPDNVAYCVTSMINPIWPWAPPPSAVGMAPAFAYMTIIIS
eukprot:12060870-Ditylum_brightwellii.AAC.1